MKSATINQPPSGQANIFSLFFTHPCTSLSQTPRSASREKPLELLELDLPGPVRVDLVDQVLDVDREPEVVLDDLQTSVCVLED